MRATSSHSPPAPGGTSQRDSTHRVVSSLASGIASTPTLLCGHENLPTPIPNPESCTTITNPLITRATKRNQRQRQWQLQLQAVSTPQSVVSCIRSIHQFGHLDMTCLALSIGRLMELYMWNTRPRMRASNLEMVSNATRRAAKALVEAPHWQIIEKYRNTAMEQNTIWSIAFEACPKEILKEVCYSDGPWWILQAQSSTRFEHKSTKLNPILFN
jgi:hypothetical protein